MGIPETPWDSKRKAEYCTVFNSCLSQKGGKREKTTHTVYRVRSQIAIKGTKVSWMIITGS